MCLAILKALGGFGAIVVGIDAPHRDAAKAAGALAVVDPNAPDALQQITEAAGGAVWAVVGFVGSSGTVRLGYDAITKGGKIIVVGLFGGEITISTPFIPIKAMTLQGSYTGSLTELKELIDLMRTAPLPLIPVQRRPLDRPTRRSPTSRKARLSAAPCCRPVDHRPRCARRPAASAGLSAGPPSGWSR